MLLQEREWFRSQVRAGFDAEALHLGGRHRPDAMKLSDRQRRDEGRTHFGGDHKLPIRLAIAGRQLGEELVIGHARRRGQARLFEDARADFLSGR